jgi:hypothetical protein
MKRTYIKAFNALKKLGVPVYEHADDNGNFSISAEEPESHKWVNYYAEYPYWKGHKENPVLNNLLHKYGLFAEWVNCGRLSVYEA